MNNYEIIDTAQRQGRILDRVRASAGSRTWTGDDVLAAVMAEGRNAPMPSTSRSLRTGSRFNYFDLLKNWRKPKAEIGGGITDAIAGHERFLAESRAQHPGGMRVSIGNYDRIPYARREQNPDLWRVAEHEAAHVVGAFVLGAGIESAVARTNRSGVAILSPGFDRVLGASELATVYAMGAAANRGPMQDHAESADGSRFSSILTSESGVPVVPDVMDDNAWPAMSRASQIADHYAEHIMALAVILFDEADIPIDGRDLRAVFDEVTRAQEQRERERREIIHGKTWL